MDFILQFLGKTVNLFLKISNNFAISALLYIVLVSVLILKLINDSNDNVIIGDYLRPQANEIRRSKLSENEKNEKLFSVSAKHGYVMFADQICDFSKTLFGSLFAIGCLDSSIVSKEVMFINMNISISPKNLLMNHDKGYIISMVCILIAAILKYFRNDIAQNHLLVNQETLDLIITVLLMALAALIPSAFSIYWAIFEILHFAYFIFATKINKEKRLKKLSIKFKKIK